MPYKEQVVTFLYEAYGNSLLMFQEILCSHTPHCNLEQQEVTNVKHQISVFNTRIPTKLEVSSIRDLMEIGGDD